MVRQKLEGNSHLVLDFDMTNLGRDYKTLGRSVFENFAYELLNAIPEAREVPVTTFKDLQQQLEQLHRPEQPIAIHFTVLPIAMAIAGFAILLATPTPANTSLEYAALFLVTMGVYSALPVTVCWFNMNLAGYHRRAVGSAWQIAFGNIGGIVANTPSSLRISQSIAPGIASALASAA